MRADELVCEGLKSKNKMYLQKFLVNHLLCLVQCKGDEAALRNGTDGELERMKVCYGVKRGVAN